MNMIQLNEIRLGNWFKHNDQWSYVNKNKEHFFQWDDVDWYALSECTLFVENVEPIPLTNKILEQIGFVSHGGNRLELQLDSDDVDLIYTDNGVYLTFETYAHRGEPANYLHELQNLYFDLTRKELFWSPEADMDEEMGSKKEMK